MTLFVNVGFVEHDLFSITFEFNSFRLYSPWIPRIQTSMGTIWCVRSSNVAGRIGVYFAHETCFIVPVFGRILNNTQAINPEVEETETSRDTDRVSKRRRQELVWDILTKRGEIGLEETYELVLAPAMTQC
jgi:hypothetical protein